MRKEEKLNIFGPKIKPGNIAYFYGHQKNDQSVLQVEIKRISFRKYRHG